MWILSVVLFALILWRMIIRLRCHAALKTVLAIAAAIGCFKFQWVKLLGGKNFFAPDLPDWVLSAGTWLYAVVYFLFPLLLAETLLWGMFKIRKSQWYEKRKHIFHITMLVLAAVLSSAAMYNGAKAPVVTRLEITLDTLPSAADGMTAAFLADLHIDRKTPLKKIRDIVDMTNREKPDLILLGGDLVDGRVEDWGKGLAELAKLRARSGVFGAIGNHEQYSGLLDSLRSWQKAGITPLVNASVELPNGLILAGVGDRAAEKSGSGPDWEKTFDGIPEKRCVLLLCHRPGPAEKAVGYGADLQLSGHTHGGMIRGFDMLVALFNNNFVSGFYRVGSMQLLVSNGTALWSGFPLRLGRPSEILLITLRKKRL